MFKSHDFFESLSDGDDPWCLDDSESEDTDDDEAHDTSDEEEDVEVSKEPPEDQSWADYDWSDFVHARLTTGPEDRRRLTREALGRRFGFFKQCQRDVMLARLEGVEERGVDGRRRTGSGKGTEEASGLTREEEWLAQDAMMLAVLEWKTRMKFHADGLQGQAAVAYRLQKIQEGHVQNIVLCMVIWWGKELGQVTRARRARRQDGRYEVAESRWQRGDGTSAWAAEDEADEEREERSLRAILAKALDGLPRETRLIALAGHGYTMAQFEEATKRDRTRQGPRAILERALSGLPWGTQVSALAGHVEHTMARFAQTTNSDRARRRGARRHEEHEREAKLARQESRRLGKQRRLSAANARADGTGRDHKSAAAGAPLTSEAASAAGSSSDPEYWALQYALAMSSVSDAPRCHEEGTPTPATGEHRGAGSAAVRPSKGEVRIVQDVLAANSVSAEARREEAPVDQHNAAAAVAVATTRHYRHAADEEEEDDTEGGLYGYGYGYDPPPPYTPWSPAHPPWRPPKIPLGMPESCAQEQQRAGIAHPGGPSAPTWPARLPRVGEGVVVAGGGGPPAQRLGPIYELDGSTPYRYELPGNLGNGSSSGVAAARRPFEVIQPEAPRRGGGGGGWW